MNTKEMISKGKSLLDNKGRIHQFGYFSKVYPMTTENIKGYFKYYDMRNKDILTVCSSGDHIFDAFLMGAKSVDCFDINALCEYFYYFKKALIETSSFKEFQEKLVFNLIPTGTFKEQWYEKLRDYIEKPYQQFWDAIMEYSLSNGIPLNNLFLIGCVGNNYYTELINYFNENDFDLLKEIIADTKVNFIHSDLSYLPMFLENTYDYIFLSNIADYFGIDRALKLSTVGLLPFVNDGGEIAYAYMYDADIHNNHTIGSDNMIAIPSIIRNTRNNDLVLTLKKH